MNIKKFFAGLFEIEQGSLPVATLCNGVSALIIGVAVLGSGYAVYKTADLYRDIGERREAAAPLVARMVEANAFAVSAIPESVLSGLSVPPRQSSYLFAAYEGNYYTCGFDAWSGVVNSCAPIAAD